MFSSQSPVKRKHCEYHDPDYPQDNSLGDHNELRSSSSNAFIKKQKMEEGVSKEDLAERQKNLDKIKDIIEREFNRELTFKQQQLEVIHERVDNAKHLLDKLRYTLVASYYKQQDLPLAAADSTPLRGSRDDKGPQTQIHPSLKKLIGKKPKNLSDVIRSCPKRTAAQNAVQTIRAKSDVQKREERKLKQIIRGQGIVIDHSVEKETMTDLKNLINVAKRTQYQGVRPVDKCKTKQKTEKAAASKPLVGTRLNNKVKHLIVVGNTSKSIVGEQEIDSSNNSQILTHKWLVYVQSKDKEVPIERFVKKIRFHLHHSYRPNDIVDVVQPPFHVARRGWGEFPIRVQLFFHDEYYQKPVLLVHNVILDKTLSGIQTLGAETLLEIWLRKLPQNEIPNQENSVIGQCTMFSLQPKQRVISHSEELVDENLLDFLNKIEATHSSISADIEKIEPTVVVADPLSVKTSSPLKNESVPMLRSIPLHDSCREKHVTSSTCSVDDTAVPNVNSIKNNRNSTVDQNDMTAIESHVKDTEEHRKEDHTMTPSRALSTETSSLHRPISFLNEPTVTKPKTTFIKLPQNSPLIRIISNTPKESIRTTNPSVLCTSKITQTPTNKASVILKKDGKIVMPIHSVSSTVRRTALPVVGSSFTLDNVNTQKVSNVSSNAPKQILQKKLVQLVDASGKVKYMQMLVAASTSPATPATMAKGQDSTMTHKFTSLNPGCKPTFTITNTKLFSQTNSAAPLSLSNGNSTSFTPAGITMKPNIFKILPENMQTKPQVVTFCTGFSASITTTITTVASTAQLTNININSIIPSNSVHLNTSIPHSKPNGGSMPKNVVFQKEGKVYIIDPLQTKLKQQQKKQVSLLKPQVSLLKQQILQKKQESSSQSNVAPEQQQNVITGVSNVSVRKNIPQLHFGLKQQRINTINTLQLMQMKMILFEKQFLKQGFGNMRSAVEFLLRRLRLVVHKDSLAGVYPFVTHSIIEFQSLTAFKQRSYEWLRAKQISRMIRSHKDLQRINTHCHETFWTTKEIALFARQYAYTPEIKSLPKLVENSNERAKNFQDIVKSQLHQKPSAIFDTLTNHKVIFRWIDKIWPILVDHEQIADQNQIIDVSSVPNEPDDAKRHKVNARFSNFKLSSSENYLSTPSKLETECNLVKEICRDLNFSLEPEELVPTVWHASTQTVLAQCVQIFLQKIIRNTIANKKQDPNASNEFVHHIQPADIAKVLSTSEEFDFLTNKNFGSLSNTNHSDGYSVPIIKQENS